MKTARLDVYLDAAGKWRWRHVAANGRITADGGQGYVHIESAYKGFDSFCRSVGGSSEGVPVRVIRS